MDWGRGVEGGKDQWWKLGSMGLPLASPDIIRPSIDWSYDGVSEPLRILLVRRPLDRSSPAKWHRCHLRLKIPTLSRSPMLVPWSHRLAPQWVEPCFHDSCQRSEGGVVPEAGSIVWRTRCEARTRTDWIFTVDPGGASKKHSAADTVRKRMHVGHGRPRQLTASRQTTGNRRKILSLRSMEARMPRGKPSTRVEGWSPGVRRSSFMDPDPHPWGPP